MVVWQRYDRTLYGTVLYRWCQQCARLFCTQYSPGGYPPETDRKYTYINHVGDIRMEANIEYRFRMIADLHGAVFLDAGNVC